MAVTNIIERTVDIDVGVTQEDLRRLFAVADAQAHTFKITVMSKGQAQSLSGHTVVGYFMTNYFGTVVINGSISGNVATLTLPAACYANNTGFQLIIRLVSGSTKTSIYWGSGYVSRSASSPAIDPGSVIPNIDDLLAKIDQMEQATQAANTAATNANTAAEKSIRYDTAQSLTDAQKAQARRNAGSVESASIAEAYTSKTYAVGDRVMYEGRLYECTTVITTAESWTPAHWTAKNLVSDITDLKEDLKNVFPDNVKAALFACFENVEWVGGNGATLLSTLKSALGSRLPDAYNEVLYIESSGTQYIVTNILSQIPLKMEAKISVSDKQAPVIGAVSQQDTSNSRFFLAGVATYDTGACVASRFGNGGWIYTENFYTFDTPIIINSEVAYSQDMQSLSVHLSDPIGDQTQVAPILTHLGEPIMVFIKPTSMTPVPMKLYYMKFYVDGDLIFDGVPCVRKNDSKPGLYDVINDVFYTNSGTGEFIYV